MASDNAEANAGTIDLTFPNILAVVEYLKAGGWKIAKSMAYQHRNDGKIRPQEDGLFHIKDVVKYAKTFLRRLDGAKMDALDTIQQEKLRGEVDKLQAQAEHWQIRTKALAGAYVDKEAFERELAKRAAIFRNDMETFCRSQAADIIAASGGDPAKAPDLIQYLLERTEEFFARYSEEKEFRVPLPPPDMDVEPGDEDDEGEDE